VEENRKAVRYDIHVPMHVCMSQRQPPEFHGAQLRDISRTGILFHSEISFEIGITLELPFCPPAERERRSCVLARATVKTIRALVARDHWRSNGGLQLGSRRKLI
jgi:hypothetical protein